VNDHRYARPDPSALFLALGAEVVKQKAANGEGEAQFSQGCLLVSGGRDGDAGWLGASGRSPMANVGLALPPACLDSLTTARSIDAITWSDGFCAGANPALRRAWRFGRRRRGKGTRTLCVSWGTHSTRERSTSKPWSGSPRPLRPGCRQGLTLVHFLAQREHVLWDMWCIQRLFRNRFEV
jgi:hypothetical protein